jgi:hypothetical protein
MRPRRSPGLHACQREAARTLRASACLRPPAQSCVRASSCRDSRGTLCLAQRLAHCRAGRLLRTRRWPSTATPRQRRLPSSLARTRGHPRAQRRLALTSARGTWAKSSLRPSSVRAASRMWRRGRRSSPSSRCTTRTSGRSCRSYIARRSRSTSSIGATPRTRRFSHSCSASPRIPWCKRRAPSSRRPGPSTASFTASAT